eukprot:TRINITY_DN5653_c0_g1_i2.p1 TRINITY_DN5653_c0_g1~~TRINITY_DN5653_c0_g1_i2.p1  ORF type:complete len:1129 (-),score=277.83 TRINITY_DN5653_c0_g1_i2:2146-5511(-)
MSIRKRKDKRIKNSEPITSITVGSKIFKSLKGKSSLDFSGDEFDLEDVDFLHSFSDLKELNLSNNSLTAFNGEQYGLHKLKYLAIENNRLRTVSLRGMRSLENINLNNNRIRGISGLESLLKLQHFELSENDINNFSDFHHLRSLRYLDLSSNSIDMQPSQFLEDVIEKINVLPKLTSLSFKDNPVETSIQEFFHFLAYYMENLKTYDGIPITKEVRSKAKGFKDTYIWEDDSIGVKRAKKRAAERMDIQQRDTMFSTIDSTITDIMDQESSSNSDTDIDMSSLENFLNQELALEPSVKKQVKTNTPKLNSSLQIDMLLKNIIEDKRSSGSSSNSPDIDYEFLEDSITDILGNRKENVKMPSKQILPLNLATGDVSSKRIQLGSSSSSSSSSKSDDDILAKLEESLNMTKSKETNIDSLLKQVGLESESSSDELTRLIVHLDRQEKKRDSRGTSVSESDILADILNEIIDDSPKPYKNAYNSDTQEIDDIINSLDIMVTGGNAQKVDSSDSSKSDQATKIATPRYRKEDDDSLNDMLDSLLKDNEVGVSSSSENLSELLKSINNDRKTPREAESSDMSDLENLLSQIENSTKNGSSKSESSSIENKSSNSSSNQSVMVDETADPVKIDMADSINTLYNHMTTLPSDESSSSSSDIIIPKTTGKPYQTSSTTSGTDELGDLLKDLSSPTKPRKSSSSSSSGIEIDIPQKNLSSSETDDLDDLEKYLSKHTVEKDPSSSSTEESSAPKDTDNLLDDLEHLLKGQSSSRSSDSEFDIPLPMKKSNLSELDSEKKSKSKSSKSSDSIDIPIPGRKNSSKSSDSIDIPLPTKKSSSSSSDSIDIPLPKSCSTSILPSGSHKNNFADFAQLENELRDIEFSQNLSSLVEDDKSDDLDIDIPLPKSSTRSVNDGLSVSKPLSNVSQSGISVSRSFSSQTISTKNDDNILGDLQNTLVRSGSANFGSWEHDIPNATVQRNFGEGVYGVSYLGTVGDKIIRAKKLYIQISQLDTIKREISSLKVLDHPNIVSILGSKDKQYVIQPFIKGQNLNKFLEEENDLTPSFKLLVAREIAKSVLYLHNQGITHGSIKPSNVIMDNNHKLWLLDHGFMFIKVLTLILHLVSGKFTS